MTTTQTPRFDREKFKDVVHFVCANVAHDRLGNVKLHKILYFADMLKFHATQEAMTGVEYQKQQFGPVAKMLSSALAQLEKEGRVCVKVRDYYGFQKKEYHSLQPPSSARLSNVDIAILRDVIDFVTDRTAREISELSHNAAWEAASNGETIPYFTVLGWHPLEVTDEDLAEGASEARSMRSVIEAEIGAS